MSKLQLHTAVFGMVKFSTSKTNLPKWWVLADGLSKTLPDGSTIVPPNLLGWIKVTSPALMGSADLFNTNPAAGYSIGRPNTSRWNGNSVATTTDQNKEDQTQRHYHSSFNVLPKLGVYLGRGGDHTHNMSTSVYGKCEVFELTYNNKVLLYTGGNTNKSVYYADANNANTNTSSARQVQWNISQNDAYYNIADHVNNANLNVSSNYHRHSITGNTRPYLSQNNANVHNNEDWSSDNPYHGHRFYSNVTEFEKQSVTLYPIVYVKGD